MTMRTNWTVLEAEVAIGAPCTHETGSVSFVLVLPLYDLRPGLILPHLATELLHN